MGDIINLKPQENKFEDRLKDLGREIKNDDITHAIMIYRRQDGTVSYIIKGEEHGTYMIGVLNRIILDIHSRLTEEQEL